MNNTDTVRKLTKKQKIRLSTISCIYAAILAWLLYVRLTTPSRDIIGNPTDYAYTNIIIVGVAIFWAWHIVGSIIEIKYLEPKREKKIQEREEQRVVNERERAKRGPSPIDELGNSLGAIFWLIILFLLLAGGIYWVVAAIWVDDIPMLIIGLFPLCWIATFPIGAWSIVVGWPDWVISLFRISNPDQMLSYLPLIQNLSKAS